MLETKESVDNSEQRWREAREKNVGWFCFWYFFENVSHRPAISILGRVLDDDHWMLRHSYRKCGKMIWQILADRGEETKNYLSLLERSTFVRKFLLLRRSLLLLQGTTLGYLPYTCTGPNGSGSFFDLTHREQDRTEDITEY